ncbi:sensor histidine kinase [Salininema proteolyticum]|uniref:histidine kinase n=1 Tax=Salininema proteolyticum TaxID=1607685 RepID=A0ABV8TYL1_9ACTN
MESTMRRLRRDSVYNLASFPVSLAAFITLLVLTVVGVATAIIWIGVPVLAAGLLASRGFRIAELSLGAPAFTRPTPRISYSRPPEGAGPLRRMVQPIFDAQSWLNVLWAIINLPLAIFGFVITVVWWSVTVAALLWPAYDWIIVATTGAVDEQGIAYASRFLGLGDSYLAQSAVAVAGGLVFALTLPYVMRTTALIQGSMAQGMLNATAHFTQRISDLSESRAAAQSAESEALRRIERDIHDGPQQQLVNLGMELARVKRQMDRDPEAARETLDTAIDQTRLTIDELRSLSRGIAPPVLADRGLPSAIEALAARSMIPVAVDADIAGRYPSQVENTVYFVIAESLANAAKHSRATQISVVVRDDATTMAVCVTDNGIGGANLSKGHGLAGLAERVKSVEGQLSVDSPEGGPTVVVAEVPCA